MIQSNMFVVRYMFLIIFTLSFNNAYAICAGTAGDFYCNQQNYEESMRILNTPPPTYSNSNETSSSNSYSYEAPMKASQYGAVAQNPKTGAVGMANRQRSKAKANKEALADCGEAGCKIISSYANTCMVLANATNGFWVIRNGESEILAERLALSVCSENGSDCKVFFSECSLP